MGELKFTALLDASLNPERSAAIERIASKSRITRQPHCTGAAISLLWPGNTCDLSSCELPPSRDLRLHLVIAMDGRPDTLGFLIRTSDPRQLLMRQPRRVVTPCNPDHARQLIAEGW
jgi:hypothetical protein